MKLATYIAIIDLTDNRNTLRFVTSLESSNALWEAGKPAKAFSKTVAKDVLMGLCLNGYSAIIVKSTSLIVPNNKEEE